MEHVGYNQDTIYASIHTQSYNHVADTQKTAAKQLKGVSEGFHIWLPSACYSTHTKSGGVEVYFSLLFPYMASG
ncbi:hypothetical protein SAMN02745217_00663 [Anaerocolumna xylanovorans DSM 12503]|uniref:Uncharacterized protein n=1 Tax=Anaerocolumna xylanovorans DSM 12503 TaxID=1121345 RepID=A0A1M7XZM8_9FIRM|nr:hypothetical protein SAMN02745217_00663 [Anaerocolumna xylanovorans DSM 12503]